MSRFKEEETGTGSRLQNGESASPNSNVDMHAEAAATNSFKPHLLEQKNGRRKSDVSLEEMYNSRYDFGNDEDDDSDWEPSALPAHTAVEIPKWFCLNCTMLNIGDDLRCDVCGEHRESGILEHGFLAPASCRKVVTENGTHSADGLRDSKMRSIASNNPTAIGFDERMLLHEEVVMKSHPHPERPDRLRAIASSLATAGIFPGMCYPISAREITREELLKVHSLENIEAVELTSRVFSSYFTPDTYANQYSATAAKLAAGLCFDLAAAIWSGSAKNGFALVRPPGHHAGVKHAMGFCLHNNAAVAASAAQIAGAKKVLIIDWDVHHGNGTQEIFEKNKSVLYISLHRHEGGKFYPGTGSAYEIGSMGAEGYCVNIPWGRGGVGDNDYIFAFQHVVLPIATAFDPDFTIISAGFDAARGDPLGGCDVTPAGYAQMTQMCCSLTGGKVLVILEGGYNLRSISSSATAVIKVLLGESPRQNVEQAMPSKAGVRTVLEVLKIQLNYWSSLEPNFSKLQSEWGLYTLVDKKDQVNAAYMHRTRTWETLSKSKYISSMGRFRSESSKDKLKVAASRLGEKKKKREMKVAASKELSSSGSKRVATDSPSGKKKLVEKQPRVEKAKKTTKSATKADEIEPMRGDEELNRCVETMKRTFARLGSDSTISSPRLETLHNLLINLSTGLSVALDLTEEVDAFEGALLEEVKKLRRQLHRVEDDRNLLKVKFEVASGQLADAQGRITTLTLRCALDAQAIQALQDRVEGMTVKKSSLKAEAARLKAEAARLRVGDGVNMGVLIESEWFEEMKDAIEEGAAQVVIGQIREKYPDLDLTFLDPVVAEGAVGEVGKEVESIVDNVEEGVGMIAP